MAHWSVSMDPASALLCNSHHDSPQKPGKSQRLSSLTRTLSLQNQPLLCENAALSLSAHAYLHGYWDEPEYKAQTSPMWPVNRSRSTPLWSLSNPMHHMCPLGPNKGPPSAKKKGKDLSLSQAPVRFDSWVVRCQGPLNLHACLHHLFTSEEPGTIEHAAQLNPEVPHPP